MASTSGINQKAISFSSIIVDTLIFDSIGEQVGEDIFDVDQLAIANGLNGTSESFSDSDIFSVDVVVLAGSVTSVGLFVDARGYAEVPAPPSFALLSLAVIGIGFIRHRRARPLST